VERITRVARVVCDYQEARVLSGACHELSAIGYVLLRESGIDEAELCIGVAHSPHVPSFIPVDGIAFDHSWIEIGGAPIDAACAAPLPPSIPVAPVIVGMHVDDGRPTEITYGVGGALDEDGARVASLTLAAYFDAFDREGEPTPWETTIALGATLGLTLDAATTRSRHGETRWTLRAPK